MKIVIAHTDFRIYWPARLNDLFNKSMELGHELIIIQIAGLGSNYSFSENDLIKQNWITLFPSEKIEDVKPKIASRALYEKLSEINPDVVIAGAIAFPSGATSVRWAKMKKKGVVIFDDARLIDVPRSRFVNWVKKRIYRNVDAILCPSEDWKETFSFWGFSSEQLFYGLDVVDNAFWQQSEDTEQNMSLPLNYILAVGRQVRKKNFIFLIKAFKMYKKQYASDSSLILIGEGEENFLIKQYIHENEIKDVQLLPFQSQKNLRILYHHADLFVLPSLYGETWGLVVNEALASGLPAAVSDQAGCTNALIEDNVNGYVFSPLDVDQLIAIFKKHFSKSQEDKSKMKKAALEKISTWGLNRFSEEALNAAFFSLKNKRKSNLLDFFILKFWNGRYNAS